MMEIPKNIEKIGLENYVHCYLVDNNVRDGYLIQYFEEKMSKELKKTVENIKKEFPKLHYLYLRGGILITKKEQKPDEFKSDNFNEKLGNILGYACGKDFDKLNRKETHYAYEIRLYWNDLFGLQLISYLCQTNKYEKDLKKLYEKIKKCLTNKSFIFHNQIKDIKYEVEPIYTEKHYIDLLSKDKHNFTEKEKNAIYNYLYKIGFSMNFESFLENNLDLNNPLHRGIIIGLLTYSPNPLIEPWFPLQYSGKMEKVDDLTKEWEDMLMYSIKKPKKQKKS